MKQRFIVGIDEVGRGPVAGPVTICAVRVSTTFKGSLLKGVKDSKKVSPEVREQWAKRAKVMAKRGEIAYAVASSSVSVIDRKGITRAIASAIARALRRLDLDPASTRILLDGSLKAPSEFKNQQTIIKGDEKIPLISLASNIAKVHRDRLMSRQAKKYAGYGFEIHKGYGTAKHLKAIRKLGLSDIHRRSFLKRLT